MKMKKIMLMLLISIWIFSMQAQNVSEVKVYEGKENIPTYKRGPDESSPVFYTGRGVQGAAGHIYPYPAQTSLGEKLTTVTYDMVYLENEYLKVTILPAFGGKLFSAIDKTNGHELFHRNSVIKPDLIGTLGAWISGGIEWCFPHHHRTTTLLPADYIIEKNDDGSATVWIGETERSLRLRGVIGITLHPGRSYIEANYRLSNTNDITKNFLFWANVSITSNENWRTFWPPSQEIGVFHSNNSFTQWPISHQVYKGIDYTSGVDLTWWKNHPSPVSLFFWQAKEGFIGGYDYAKNAGTIHVGDVYENKASKLWQFGPGLQGQNADRKLTDDGKPYVELMTGTFSNNQPDYSWFFPHSVKDATNYWYPLRDIEIVKNATLNASVTLQMRDSKTVFYGFNTTKTYKGAKAVLKNGDEVLVTKKVDIDPATPFTSTYKSKRELDEYQLYVELQDSDGKKLVSYQPYKLQYPKMPEVQEEPKSPQEIVSVEDLYLTGRFVEQFSRPRLNPDDYYLEALRKSPNDYRVNIAMGIRRVNQWRYEEAERYLQKAADKLKVKYIQPKEGELFYYLALAQKGMGKPDEAYSNFFQASWYYEWFSSAYYQLALMESNKGNFEKAIEFVNNAYSTNNNDGGITVLYSALLRRQGEREKALALVNKLLEFDPLNFSAVYEKELLKGNSSLTKWHNNMQDIDNNYLDITLNYVKAGLFDDAINLLSSLENPKNPLVFYYLAWLYANNNQPSKAIEMLASASRISFDYCFPFRQETEKVLKYAIENDSQNAVACYLLGNLLYDQRPDDAMKAWNLAVKVKSDFPMVWRNLAFGAFYHKNDIENSIKYMKKAIAEDFSHPLWYTELENYYDLSQSDFRECLAIMGKNIEIVKMDITAPMSLVKLYNLNGEYDKSIDLLKSHHFRTWEGGREIYYHYVDAHVLKALELIKDDKYEAAVEELNTAMLYPLNLEVGKPLDDERNAMIYYFLGKAFNKMAKMGKAKEFYEKSTLANNTSKWADLTYYQAKSFEELGNSVQATKMFQELITKGKLILEKGVGASGVAVEEISLKNNKSLSEAYYLQALGNTGLGNVDEANNLFQKSLKEYKNNLWAKLFLNNFK